MAPTSIHILVVEGEPIISEAIVDRLTTDGLDVAAVHNGLVAVERCLAMRPDLVVLDLNIPGITASRRVVENSTGPGSVELSRERMPAMAWGYRDGSGARSVDSHVRSVRRKLGDDTIGTVHGVEYAFGDPR